MLDSFKNFLNYFGGIMEAANKGAQEAGGSF